MLIRRKRGWEMRESQVTPEHLYSRRKVLGAGAAIAAAAAMPGMAQAQRVSDDPTADLYPAKLNAKYNAGEPTPERIAGNYNNFYEYGTSKDVTLPAQQLRVRPWTVKIDGMVEKEQTVDIDTLIRAMPIEERIYRLRCVEGWSMVIPWIGFPLDALLRQVEPLGSARFVEFVSYYDQARMSLPFFVVLEFPYVEGLRLDEARHPLTLLTLGLYGEVLPNPNGAPLRVVIPWKYGFKSGKSVVRVRFVEDQPLTTWNRAAPRDYGFYANVNPQVDHPRWSQAKERRIGEFLKRDTLPFNGYGEQVAGLYAGMDLARNY